MLSKYKGIFNWYGENITLYTICESMGKARINLSEQLSKKVDKPIGILLLIYRGAKSPKHEITEVTKSADNNL